MSRPPMTWAMAALVALLLSTSYLLDGPTDTEAAQAVADDLAEAQQAATKLVAAPALSTASDGKNVFILAGTQAVRP